LNRPFDDIVVGGGSFGAWTALQLRRRGRQVALIEAHAPGHNRSSSGGESRIIRMGYGPNEIYTRWSKRALELWLELFAATGRPLFHRTGVLWFARDAEPYVSSSLEIFERLDIPHQVLSRQELAHKYPQIDSDHLITWGLLEPESGVLMARRAVQAVVERAVREGVMYICEDVAPPAEAPGTKAQPLSDEQCAQPLIVPEFCAGTAAQPRLEQVTTRSGQTIRVGPEGAVVFACGPWLSKLFPLLLGDRIFTSRQEVFFFGTPPGDSRFAPPALPTWIDLANEAYGMPDLEGRGLKSAIDRHGAAFDPDAGDRLPTLTAIEEVCQYVARRFPGLTHAPLLESRVCQYENTSSGDLLLDRHPAFQNLWLAGGGSGHGFKHGPSVGEYLAGRILDNASPEPRFGLENKLTVQRRAIF
jgi:sarcosine oxidase